MTDNQSFLCYTILIIEVLMGRVDLADNAKEVINLINYESATAWDRSARKSSRLTRWVSVA